MRKLVYTLIALLATTAMQAQEAFYIYQNDGHFDGFFYDEVQKISYSRLDTLGVEHDDYVSQEIVTADSTYRIMLTAIDSVGFVQPEIRFNKRLRNMGDLGMLEYLTGQDGMKLTFSTSMPDALRPKQQDVLVCYDFDRFEGGFGGRVRSAEAQSGGYVVVCDSLTDMSDIFEQFITVDEYSADRNGNPVRRRTAGLNKAKGEYDRDLTSFSASPHLPFVYGDFTASLDLSLESTTNVKSVWNIPLIGKKYFKFQLTETLGVGLGLTYDIKLGEPVTYTTNFNNLAPLYVPAAAPIFRVKMIPEGFVRSEVHATGSMSTPKLEKRFGAEVVFDDWKVSADIIYGTPPKDNSSDNEPPLEISGTLNGFIQGGMKMPFVIRTNEFFESILSAEVEANFYAGPKLSGEFNYNPWNHVTGDKVSAWYNATKDSRINFSPITIDYEVQSQVKAIVGTSEKMTLLDGSRNYINWDFFFMPEFEQLKCKTVEGDDSKNLTVSVKPTRSTCIPTTLGIAVYDKDDRLVETSYDTHSTYAFWNYSYWDDDKLLEADFKLQPGTYTVRPILKILGQEFPAEPSEEVIISSDDGPTQMKGIRRACIGFSALDCVSADGSKSSASGSAPYLGWGPVTGTSKKDGNIITFTANGGKENKSNGDVDRVMNYDKWNFEIKYNAATRKVVGGSVRFEYVTNTYMHSDDTTPWFSTSIKTSFGLSGEIPYRGNYRFGNAWMGTAIDTDLYQVDSGNPNDYISSFSEHDTSYGVDKRFHLADQPEEGSEWKLSIYIEPEY